MTQKGSRKSANKENPAVKRHKPCSTHTQFNDSILNDITDVGCYPRLPEDHLEVQVQPHIQSDSITNNFNDLTNDNLVENTINYSTEVPIEVVNNSLNLDSVQHMVTYTSAGVDDAFFGNERPKRTYTRRTNTSNQTNGIVVDIDKPKTSYVLKNNRLNESSSSVGSRKSANKENPAVKSHKPCSTHTQFNNSILNDITNVGCYPRLPEDHLEVQAQPHIQSDSITNNFIDLTNDNLVENTINYSTEVPIEVVNNSLNLDSVQHMVTYTSTGVDDAFFGNERPRRTYTRKTNTSNQTNGIVVDIDKPKRSYVRKNNRLNESSSRFQ
ncbi:hypothetical protein CASFOL_030227 [Castilleja foliolosa]|uniref:Uncharacterized protein n=1 Tax=Castilleja foliolosa TaxID=1961234 RepID=A0ABD3C854_9LAMI